MNDETSEALPAQPPSVPAIPSTRADWVVAVGDVAEGLSDAALRLLKIKPVYDAVVTVCGSTANNIAARIDRSTKKITTETDSINNFQKLIFQKATELGLGDPGKIEHALHRLTKQALGSLENVEAVTASALDDLVEDSPPEDQVEGPDEQFYNHFIPHAERASSPEMRDLFARILAGEIRKPGSFSARTMQYMSALDQESAAEISLAKEWLFDDMVLISDKHNKGDWFVLLRHLENSGLLSNDASKTFYIPQGGLIRFTFSEKAVVFRAKPNLELQILISFLSRLGKQVFSIAGTNKNSEYPREWGKFVFEQNLDISEVILLDIQRGDDKTERFFNPVVIERRELPKGVPPNSPE